MTDRKLRISHVLIQPVLVWDDGEELSPGPALQQVQVSLSNAKGMLDGLPDEVAALAEQIAQQESENGDPL